MEDINTIYYNNFGIAFRWKKCAAKDFNKIQIVFRNTGLYFTNQELLIFSKNIDNAFDLASNCHYSKDNILCRNIILNTSYPEVTFAINMIELIDIQDLIKGTLFHLNFDRNLNKILSK